MEVLIKPEVVHIPIRTKSGEKSDFFDGDLLVVDLLFFMLWV
jgi:hypothetical protein